MFFFVENDIKDLLGDIFLHEFLREFLKKTKCQQEGLDNISSPLHFNHDYQKRFMLIV